MSKQKRVGAYLRVSTNDQSTEMQRREIEQYLAARGWESVSFYEDKATGTTAERPMLKELLRDARSRKIDVVIVWKLDRFFRSLKGLVLTLQEFSELGIDFVSLKDGIDLSTSAGRLMTHIIGAFAEFEASVIRERVRAGLANAKAKGKTLGRPKNRNDAQIHALHVQGLSLRKIARQLNISLGSVTSSIAVLKSQSKEAEKSE